MEPNEVADLITQHIAEIIRDELGETGHQVFAKPAEGKIFIVNRGQRVVHENIRFCCPHHCMSDVEIDTVQQALKKIADEYLPPRSKS